MPRAKQEFVLLNSTTREFGRDKRGRIILTKVDAGRPMELPKGFDHWKQGWQWAPVVEDITVPSHRGAATYRQIDAQVDRIARIKAPKS
jgi:hypothetical protein